MVRRREFCPQFLAESQFVILLVYLGWLEQTADLGSSLEVCSLGIPLLLLLLHDEELGIVADELLERDEEVAEVQPELVVLRVQREETLNEGGDLGTAYLLAAVIEYGHGLPDLRLKVGESVTQQISYEVGQELFVAGSRRGLVGLVDGTTDLGRRPIRRVHKVEHLHKKHGLGLESGLVVGVSDDEKDVLQHDDEELLEEGIGCLDISLGNVVDKL